ncbi:MAG: hypothetical protein U1F30_07585 [Steroidobacteraceae bacterium]
MVKAAKPKPSQAPTIGEHRQPAGDRGAQGCAGAGQRRQGVENYRQFLQIQNADPKLRAEALRRLGDLSLESGELERMATRSRKSTCRGPRRSACTRRC